MRNFALLCAALAVVSAIVSTNLWRELRAERQLTAQLRAQVAAGAPAIPETPRPALPVPVAASASPDTQAATAVAPPTATAATSARTNAALSIINQTELMKDPEYRKAMQAQLRMTLPQNYPDLAEELGLTPEETGELFDLLAEYQFESTSSTIFLAEGGQPDQAAIEEMTRRSQDIQRRQNEALSSMLGAARFEQWKGYQQTQGARVQVAQWGRTLQSAGMPLTATQMRPLTTAYIAEQRRQRDEVQTMARDFAQMGPQEQIQMREMSLERQAESNRRMLDVARSHLNAQQLEALQTSMDQQLAMSRAFMRAQQQQIQAQGQGGQTGATRVITATAP